ncbi:MAG TPA: NAD-dependent epimerase/dehydratase family protein [Baekduia sp.]|uniref:NAD-dependent epimerase/dehydratase family protein n=1 Tax=Baekduia sp. TaxID=2600305 RepID=UPI002BD77C1E|nr:NAD-dependent epimerase/dehydratase family protein [Baekduia sp.]HMJ37123.1 NAD-dependent epimerase/dehydratase family protein [Baekduia sp.]
MISKRILITGLSTYWGGRLAQALEQDPEIETIIGIDRTPPKLALDRTEFVQVSDAHSLIRRIVDAAEIDTIVDTRLVVDSIVTTRARAHENNVIGTMNVLAAAGALVGHGSPVRKLIFKSSARYYGAEQDDPAFFTEDMRRPHPPRTAIERDICEAEASVRDFRHKNPGTSVCVLRFANALGPDLRTSWQSYLGMHVVPAILGFDPRVQFIHEDDMANCLEHAVRYDLDGVFNCAADGVLALSEVVDLLGKTLAPVLPPWGTGLAAAALRRAGAAISDELLPQLRFGRALDNRRFKATGFRYQHTTRETVLRLREQQKLEPILRGAAGGSYRYESAVEEFLRFSPSVRHANLRPQLGPTNSAPGSRPVPGSRTAVAQTTGDGSEPVAAPTLPRRPAETAYGSLTAREILALLPSLGPADLQALRDHEALHGQQRTSVLRAIDRLLSGHETSAR